MLADIGPLPTIKGLDAMKAISEVWPPAHGYLQVLVGLPSEVGSPYRPIAYDAGMTETCEWIFSSSFWAIWSCSSFIQSIQHFVFV